MVIDKFLVYKVNNRKVHLKEAPVTVEDINETYTTSDEPSEATPGPFKGLWRLRGR